GGVSTEDRGRERLTIEVAVELAITGEGHHLLNPAGLEEVLDHVKNKQRLHSIKGKTLPRFGEGEKPKAAGMTEEFGRGNFAGQGRGIIGFSNRSHAGWRVMKTD